VLNYATLTDLTYHEKLLQFLIDNPNQNQDHQQVRLNQSSALEERKDAPQQLETSPLRNAHNANTETDYESEVDKRLMTSPDLSAVGTSPFPGERNAGSKLNGLMDSWQLSPHSNNKSRMMKKNFSMHSNIGGHGASGLHKDGTISEAPGQLYEVDTEKLLQSNDKTTITDLWKAKPSPSFPPFLLKLLDL